MMTLKKLDWSKRLKTKCGNWIVEEAEIRMPSHPLGVFTTLKNVSTGETKRVCYTMFGRVCADSSQYRHKPHLHDMDLEYCEHEIV